MTTSRKTQSALRAALKNEDAALAQRLPDTGKPVKPPAAKPVAAKPEKRLRETFSLARSDIDRLADLKAHGEKSGSKYGRSEMLRAGLLLLEEQDATKVSALIEGLPAFKKDKRKKK